MKLVSQNDSRNAVTTHKLQQMGFEKVYSLADGIDRWQAQGFALVMK